MPNNVCTPLFTGDHDPQTGRVTADVVGKTFAAISDDIQSGPEITTTALPTTWDGGNLQYATCAAGAKPDGVFAYDQVSGGVVPIYGPGFTVPVTAGGTVTAGDEVEVDAAGKAITLATGMPAGKAETDGTLNNDVFVRLY